MPSGQSMQYDAGEGREKILRLSEPISNIAQLEADAFPIPEESAEHFWENA